MKAPFIVLSMLLGFAGAAYPQGRPLDGELRHRIMGELFGSNSNLVGAYGAIQNILEFTPNSPNQLGICKEVGIFFASILNLKSNIENDSYLTSAVTVSEISEVQSLYSLGKNLQCFCGDAKDGNLYQDRKGDLIFLREELKQIEPHLFAVNRFTQSFFGPRTN